MPGFPHRRLRHAALAVTLAACAAQPAAAHARSCENADDAPTAGTRDTAATAVVCEINNERRSRGLRTVGARPRLGRAGRRYAEAMVERRFFSHVSPGGRTLGDRLRDSGYVDRHDRWTAGEALAWGWGSQATPASTVRAWMDSPPHRRLLLDEDFRHIGIGVALGTPFAHPDAVDATYVAELADRW
jgi:uncharacterized protein YkwD